MKKYVLTNYAIQCKDENTNTKGCFIFDLEKYRKTGLFFAVSEVFNSLQDLYDNTSRKDRTIFNECLKIR